MSDPAHDPPSDSSPQPAATDATVAGDIAAGDEEQLAELADDFASRVRRQERPTLEDYIAKHPHLEQKIRKVFPAIAMIEQSRSSSDSLPAGEGPGSTIERYKLLERIGEGGFGVVYMAEQLAPVRRKVALKVIKPGVDTKQVIARFEAERQALALMEHENIAKVLDAGATDTGRPYFVMELVKGVAITKYCDEHRLTPRARLELFMQVCLAVQHAHQKGIIHRDIKPSNVLIALYDGKPVPKVIDFGVAKATGPRLTEATMFTGFGDLIGTPQYMSPEQAELNQLDVDTRSDIYSLGVLLYELLTGTTPLESKRFKEAALLEVLRVIREEEPPRMSTRLTTTAELASIAAQRGLEPKSLSGIVKGELDWIVMKALEKDRRRRYETASGLARDVERYLRDDPVEACPPSTAYRLRKLARRHRGPVAAASLVLLALLGGIAGTSWGLLRAEQQRQSAEAKKQEALKERDAKAAALKAEQQAREDEAKARQQAFAALRSMTADVVERKFAQGAVLTEDDRAFLRGVIAQYDAFAAIKGDDADSRAVRAEGRFRVGTIRFKLGELQEAEQDYGQALDLYKQLASEFPAASEFRLKLAKSHGNRSVVRRVLGRLPEAEQDDDQALSLAKQLVAEFPSQAEFRHELASRHNNLAILLLATGRLPEAEKNWNEAVGIYEQLAADFPSRPEYRQELAGSHSNRGILLKTAGRPEEAKQDYEQALRIYQQLAAEFPSRIEFRQLLAKTYSSRGVMHDIAGQRQEAEQDYDQALRIRKQLAADFPSRPEYREELASSHNNRGAMLHMAARHEEAKQEYNQALSILRPLAADFPNQPDLRNNLGETCTNLAITHQLQGDFAVAKQLLLEGRPHLLAALKSSPRHPNYREVYRNHLNLLTGVHAGLLEQDDAVRTAEICRDLGWDPPADAYDAACFLSTCISAVAKHDKLDDKQRQEAVRFYGDAATKMLRDAVNKGYRDVAHMKKDTDLEPLRGREDFQKLVAELEAQPKNRTGDAADEPQR